MKTAKRLKIFGSMRKAHDRRKEKQISNSTSNDSRDKDCATLGVKRFKDESRNDNISMTRSFLSDGENKLHYRSPFQNSQVHEKDIFESRSQPTVSIISKYSVDKLPLQKLI